VHLLNYIFSLGVVVFMIVWQLYWQLPVQFVIVWQLYWQLPVQSVPISCVFEPRSWWGVLDTTLCDKVCQWLATGGWFSSGTPLSSTNKTDHHDITEILLEVVLNTINHQTIFSFIYLFSLKNKKTYSSKTDIRNPNMSLVLKFFLLIMSWIWPSKGHNSISSVNKCFKRPNCGGNCKVELFTCICNNNVILH